MTTDNNNNRLLKVGQVVELQHLTSSPDDLNGRFGIVQSFADPRYEVSSIDGHGKRRLAIKPENLKTESIIQPWDPEFSSAREFQHVVFWPRPKKDNKILPVHAFEDWPSGHYDEEAFLRERLHWKNPQVVGGVESRGVDKPDFMLYLDAGNSNGPINMTAKSILGNLPNYELGKLAPECRVTQPRGACVLIYSDHLILFQIKMALLLPQ